MTVRPNASHHAKTNQDFSRLWSFHFFYDFDETVNLRVVLPEADKKNDCFIIDEFCKHWNTVFEAIGSFYHSFPYQEARLFLSDADIETRAKEEEQEEMRRHYIEQK